MLRSRHLFVPVAVAVLLTGACSLLGGDEDQPLAPTEDPSDGGTATEPPVDGEPTAAVTDAPTGADLLTGLLDAGADKPLSFVTVGGDGSGLQIDGAADPATDRFALRFDYEAMIAVVAASDPAVAADPLLDDAAEVFGGEWQVRSADGVVYVRNPGVVALAAGADGQWVRLPHALAATLIGPDGLELFALPAEVGRRLAGADPAPAATADEVDDVPAERFEGTITVAGATVGARIWLSDTGEIRRMELDFAEGTITSTYGPPDGPINRLVRAPDPADVVDLPEGFGS